MKAIERMYVSSEGINKHAILINITKSGEVQYRLMLHHKYLKG